MSQAMVSYSLLKAKQRPESVTDDDIISNELDKKDKIFPSDFKLKPLFGLAEDIVNRAIHNVTRTVMESRENMENEGPKIDAIRLREKFSDKLDRISFQMAYNTSSRENVHKATLSIIKELSGESWEAKLALTLAAFALNYGECWRLAFNYSSNQLSKSLSMLKQARADVHTLPSFSTLQTPVNDLVKAIMDVTRCIIDFREMVSQLENAESQTEFSSDLDQIRLPIYWVIRAVFASATQITSLTSMAFNYEISSTDKEELKLLTEKLNKIKETLKGVLDKYDPIIVKESMNKRLKALRNLLLK